MGAAGLAPGRPAFRSPLPRIAAGHAESADGPSLPLRWRWLGRDRAVTLAARLPHGVLGRRTTFWSEAVVGPRPIGPALSSRNIKLGVPPRGPVRSTATCTSGRRSSSEIDFRHSTRGEPVRHGDSRALASACQGWRGAARPKCPFRVISTLTGRRGVRHPRDRAAGKTWPACGRGHVIADATGVGSHSSSLSRS